MKTCKTSEKIATALAILLTIIVINGQASADSLKGEAQVSKTLDFNETPTAIAGGPYTVNENEAVKLDGTKSKDPEGQITYNWELPSEWNAKVELKDQNTARPIVHVPQVNSNRKITVTLTVTDNYGETSEDKTSLIIKNVPRPAEFDLTDLRITPETARPNETVEITANLVNRGEKKGDYEINLLIDNVLEESKMYTAKPKEIIPVKFKTSRENEKTYNISLNELNGDFAVKGTFTPYLFLIALILFLIVGIIITLFWWVIKNRKDRKKTTRLGGVEGNLNSLKSPTLETQKSRNNFLRQTALFPFEIA